MTLRGPRALGTALFLAFAAAALAGCGRDEPPQAGEAAAAEADADGPSGRWKKARAAESAELNDAAGVGYLGAVRTATAASGVTVCDEARAEPGLNLITSGHAAWAGIMDLKGKLLHRWTCSFETAFPSDAEAAGRQASGYFRRAALLPDGRLLAIFEGLGLVLLGRDSQVQFALRNGAHHDLEVTESGEIWVLAREALVDTHARNGKPVLRDRIDVVDLAGNVLRSIDVEEALRRSEFAPALDRVAGHRDPLHTNTLELLDGRIAGRAPAFAAGSVLLSFRTLDALAVLDPAAERITWFRTGSWRAQHQPSVLDSGRLLLFDNRGGDPAAGGARVLEIEPDSGAIAWSFAGTAQRPLASEQLGSAARLSNGNTLVTESDSGRAIEVDAAGAIVWEFWNPQRQGELIATLPEVVRFPAARASGWLAAAAGK